MQSSGYEIQATETQVGDQLEITDLVLTMTVPEDDFKTVLDLGELTLSNNNDGTVSITLPEETEIGVSTDAGEDPFALTLRLRSDLTTVVSGDPDTMTYTYRANEALVNLAELVVDDEPIEDVEIAAVMTNLTGSSELTVSEEIYNRAESALERLTVTVAANDPEGSGVVNAKIMLAGMKAEAESTMPDVDFNADPAALFTEAFAVKGGYTYETMDAELSFDDGSESGDFAIKTGAGDLELDMSSEAMIYSGSATDTSFTGSGSEVPLPIDVNFGEFSYGFELPLSASEEQQDFGLNLVLADLEISELLWGLFDPTQALARDPATLIIDIAGKGTILTDLFTLDENTDEMPGELNALTLRELRLNLAGASLEGAGDFIFDNSDLESFDGLPRPEGAATVNIQGVNGLMDTLVDMGLLPEEQAMGARMMMSIFTQPGDGEDTLTSKIEINEDGHVLANGQRLR